MSSCCSGTRGAVWNQGLVTCRRVSSERDGGAGGKSPALPARRVCRGAGDQPGKSLRIRNCLRWWLRFGILQRSLGRPARRLSRRRKNISYAEVLILGRVLLTGKISICVSFDGEVVWVFGINMRVFVEQQPHPFIGTPTGTADNPDRARRIVELVGGDGRC